MRKYYIRYLVVVEHCKHDILYIRSILLSIKPDLLWFPVRRKTCMTFDGFARFMNSEETHIFCRDRAQVYQDMDQPLTNYFISTSHKTYLLNGQLVGESHPWAYAR